MKDTGFATFQPKLMFFSFGVLSTSKRDVAVVYFAHPLVDASELAISLSEYFDIAPEPSQIWFLGSLDMRADLERLAADSRIASRIPAVTRYVDSPDVVIATIDAAGELSIGPPGAAPTNVAADTRDRLLARGMSAIFRSRAGLLSSSAGYHYVKPSGTHSRAFLRAANVLLGGTELSFVALAVSARMGAQVVDAIYTDTSSVNSVAYAVADMRRRLDPTRPTARIESFGSYEGLRLGKLPPVSTNSWAIISASTSGDLGATLESQHALPVSRQVTLYYVGALAVPSAVCDLTERGPESDGFVPVIESWTPGTCPHCPRESTIKLTGDQFLPANPVVTAHMLTSREVPPWLSTFVESIYGTGAVRTHCEDGSQERRVRSVVFRADKIISQELEFEPSLGRRLARILEKSVPAGARWIIYLDDPDSQTLAERVRRHLEQCGVYLGDSNVIGARELTSPGFERKLDGGVVLVVASVVVSGRSLLTVSRALRSAHAGEPIAYLALIARLPTQRDLDTLVSDLSYGDDHPREHRVDVVQAAHLPADLQSAWSLEGDLWRRVRDRLISLVLEDERRDVVQAAIDARLERLDRAPQNGGLGDFSFLPAFGADSTEHNLALQPNFAFWPGWSYTSHKSGAAPTQPEVYLTLLAVLNYLRGENGRLSGDLYNEHNWRVIAPRNFSRFNDAVIQAAILRGAVAQELDYSSDGRMSAEMAELMRSIISNWSGDDGRCAGEALLALADERVRLTLEGYLGIRDTLEALGALPALLDALRLFLVDQWSDLAATGVPGKSVSL